MKSLKAEIEGAIGEAVREAASLCEEMCALLESGCARTRNPESQTPNP